jgi:tRNA wybutosine-synthesizing protein 2
VVIERGAKFGFDVELLEKRVVKSYAPHIWHVVLDIEAIPKD